MYPLISIAPIKKAPGGALCRLVAVVINQGCDYAREDDQDSVCHMPPVKQIANSTPRHTPNTVQPIISFIIDSIICD